MSHSDHVKMEHKHSALTAKIIGCAMAVHTALGSGFREFIYQNALEMEMEHESISFSREHEMPIFFNGRQIGIRRADFLVEGVVCVELKAVAELEDAHFAQAINYLEASDLEVGLLINFGAKSLDFRRVTNKSFKQRAQGNPVIPPSRRFR